MPSGPRHNPPDQARMRALAAGVVHGVVKGLRRLVAGPDWPLASALLLSLAALTEAAFYTGGPATSDGSTAMLLNLLATAPLALRRGHLPVAVAIVTTATFLLLGSATQGTVSGITGQLIVLYLAGERYRRRVLLLLTIPFVLNAVSPAGGGREGLLLLVLAVAALALGDARRLRGQAIAELDATRRAMAESRRDQAVLEERARIARELHDVVAHHVSVIAVQAETARLTTADLPEQGRQSLEAIGDTARDALSELRRLLGVLRSDAGAGGEADLAPQPGLDRLDELVASARATGARVRLTLRGAVVPLPPGVELNAYRIVQEALTNARRHAPGADVDVELAYDAEALRVRVRDSGPGPTGDASGGHGLLGMRERAAMVGGELRAGPADGGGFAVEADLPLHGPGS